MTSRQSIGLLLCLALCQISSGLSLPARAEAQDSTVGAIMSRDAQTGASHAGMRHSEGAPAQANRQADVVSLTPTSSSDHVVSAAPTASPTNNATSFVPTMAPADNTTSAVPTVAPTDNSTASEAPTPAPTNANVTQAPTPVTVAPVTIPPTAAPVTMPPTAAPTELPTASPTKQPSNKNKKHRLSVWRIIGKTIAWLIIIALSVLAFGACMSNRYRIYYYARAAWYSFLRWRHVQWLIRKLRLERFFGLNDSSLNEIIFDNNDLQEGLLMQDP